MIIMPPSKKMLTLSRLHLRRVRGILKLTLSLFVYFVAALDIELLISLCTSLGIYPRASWLLFAYIY